MECLAGAAIFFLFLWYIVDTFNLLSVANRMDKAEEQKSKNTKGNNKGNGKP